MRAKYTEFVNESNREGSNKATSYIRALDMLGAILKERSNDFSGCSDIWTISSPELISQIYEYVLVQQREGERGIFKGHFSPGYWRNRFYSAALKSYREFLVVCPHEERLWKIYKQPKSAPEAIAHEMNKVEIKAVKELVSDRDLDFRTKEGRDVLQKTKTRVNQDFFRKMILAEYRCQCCITGLSIPEVLRASHIIGWAEDKKNRMNPANGLCLSATYDAAFDSHLISFDNDYRLILSPSLKEHYTNKAFKEQFLAFEGRKIADPDRYSPDQGLLEKHRGRMGV